MTTQRSPGLFRRLAHGSLVKQILVGLVLGILLAWISKPAAEAVGLLGTLFVGALKAVAPILVLMLVMASIANHQHGQKTNIRPILFLYLLGTFSAALAPWQIHHQMIYESYPDLPLEVLRSNPDAGEYFQSSSPSQSHF